MKHLLDNPVYNSLITGNSNLAYGTEDEKYYDAEVAFFVGLKENTNQNFKTLYDTLSRTTPSIFMSAEQIDIPHWDVVQCVPGFQMVYGGDVKLVDESNLVVLTEEHVPQMLELTKLTNPGPFAAKTINFGHYRGVFDGDKLVAMAGQRMNPTPYAEISAVCTHPDYLGRGYAKQLLQFQINRIMAEGNIPFLHVRDDNERAIRVYESMGFNIRTRVYFNIIKKKSL